MMILPLREQKTHVIFSLKTHFITLPFMFSAFSKGHVLPPSRCYVSHPSVIFETVLSLTKLLPLHPGVDLWQHITISAVCSLFSYLWLCIFEQCL